MRHTTHVIFALVIVASIYELLQIDLTYLYVATAAFGSLLPDIDHPKSYISRGYWRILSKTVSKTTSHRGWTHSLFGTFVFTSAAICILFYFKEDLNLALFFAIGYLSHLISDSLNPTKVKWFWPKKKGYGFGIIVTGSRRENIFQGILMILIGLMIGHSLSSLNFTKL